MPGSHWNQAARSQLIELYEIGTPLDAIAAALGRSKAAVLHIIKTLKPQRVLSRFPEYLATIAYPGERWAAIADFPQYFISDQGRVATAHVRFCGKILTHNVGPNGYHHVILQDGGRVRAAAVHRLLAETCLGDPPSADHHAAHWDGDKDNNRLSNLRWATPGENCQDKKRHGTWLQGSRVPGASTDEATIAALKRAVRGGRSVRDAAVMLGLSYSVARSAAAGQSWRHVSADTTAPSMGEPA